MTALSGSVARRALQWCEAEDADSIAVIVLAGQQEAFLDALQLKPGGCNETVVRQRLEAVSKVCKVSESNLWSGGVSGTDAER